MTRLDHKYIFKAFAWIISVNFLLRKASHMTKPRVSRMSKCALPKREGTVESNGKEQTSWMDRFCYREYLEMLMQSTTLDYCFPWHLFCWIAGWQWLCSSAEGHHSCLPAFFYNHSSLGSDNHSFPCHSKSRNGKGLLLCWLHLMCFTIPLWGSLLVLSPPLWIVTSLHLCNDPI